MFFLDVFPVTWQSRKEHIVLICYDTQNKKHTIWFDKVVTEIFRFNEPISEKELANIINNTTAHSGYASSNDKQTVILYDISEKNVNSGIEHYEIDPYGSLISLFEHYKIDPYSWLSVEMLNNDHAVSVKRSTIEELPEGIKMRSIFYLIDHDPFTISIIETSKEGSYGTILTHDKDYKNNKIKVETHKNTEAMIRRLQEIINKFNPDRIITYGNDVVKNAIDLKSYFSLRFSYYTRFDLPVVIDKMLGVEIEDNRTFSKLQVLHDIYFKFVQGDIEKLCNKMKVTNYQLTTLTPKKIIDRMAYHYDPASLFVRHSCDCIYSDYYVLPQFGAYQGVYVYDYSKLLSDILGNSNDKLTQLLSSSIEGCGMKLAAELWCAPFIDNNNDVLISSFDLILPKGIFEINRYGIYSLKPISDVKWLYPLGFYQIYAYLSPQSRYILDDDNTIVCKGNSQVCHPRITHQKSLIANWVNHLLNNDETSFEMIVIGPETDIRELIMKAKITPNSIHSQNEDLANISKIYYSSVKHTSCKPAQVEYLYTKNGVSIYNKNIRTSEIDFEKYNSLLKELYLKLSQVKQIRFG